MKQPICITLTSPLLISLSDYLKSKGYRNVSVKRAGPASNDPCVVACDITYPGQPVVADKRTYHATFYTDVDEWCKKNNVIYRDTIGSYEMTNPPNETYEYSHIELCDNEAEDGCQIGDCAKVAEYLKEVDGEEVHVCSDHAFESDDESGDEVDENFEEGFDENVDGNERVN